VIDKAKDVFLENTPQQQKHVQCEAQQAYSPRNWNIVVYRLLEVKSDHIVTAELRPTTIFDIFASLTLTRSNAYNLNAAKLIMTKFLRGIASMNVPS